MFFIRNILRRKLRSIMTLLGAAVGIAIFTAISAITANLEQETRQVIDDYNSDITVQGKAAPSPLHSRMKAEDIAALQAFLGDGQVDPLVVGALRENWSSYAMILGIPPSLVPRFGLVEGRPIPASGHDVIVGTILAQKLGVRHGDPIPLGEDSATVTGIFSMGNRLVDGAVVTNLAEAQRLLDKKGQINIALVRIRNKQEAGKIVREINRRFPRLNAQSTSDFVGNIRLFRTISTFSRSVAIITFLGSCLLVSNTLLMAVSERTREVGILMAVGWRPRHVIGMLTAESLALCLGGAITGNIMALLILRTLNNSQAIGFGWIPVTISTATALASLGVSMALALLAMIWPAIILYRLSPVEALRYE